MSDRRADPSAIRSKLLHSSASGNPKKLGEAILEYRSLEIANNSNNTRNNELLSQLLNEPYEILDLEIPARPDETVEKKPLKNRKVEEGSRIELLLHLAINSDSLETVSISMYVHGSDW